MKAIVFITFLFLPITSYAQCIGQPILPDATIPQYKIISAENMNELWTAYSLEFPNALYVKHTSQDFKDTLNNHCLISTQLENPNTHSHLERNETFIIKQSCENITLSKISKLRTVDYCQDVFIGPEPPFFIWLNKKEAIEVSGEPN